MFGMSRHRYTAGMVQGVRTWLVVAALFSAGAALVWYATRPQPISVALHTVERGDVRSTVANTRAGTVKACRRARLAPPLGGQIARLPVAEGDAVEAGQVLLELWSEDLQAELLLAERDATAAKSRADQACVLANVARKEADRVASLRREGLASEERADQTEGDARAQRAACRAARTTATVSEAAVTVRRANLERMILRAPFDGTVAEINGEVGEFVTPSPVGIPTPPAIDLVDNSCLYISAPIDEVDAPAIEAGMRARITLDAFPDRQFDGTVRRIAPYVLDLEKQARTVDIEAVIADPDTRLLPGYSADVEVILAVAKDVVRVPTQTLLDGDRLLVFDAATSTLVDRDVTVGIANWQFTQVTSGLRAGDRVVLSVDREGVEAGAVVEPDSPAEP